MGWLIYRFFVPEGKELASLTALLIGLSLGAEVDMMSFLTSRYFCMKSYGRIYAVIYSAFVVGAAIGPLLTGRLFDLQGNYQQALWMVIALLLAGAGAIFAPPVYVGFRETVAALALGLENGDIQSGSIAR